MLGRRDPLRAHRRDQIELRRSPGKDCAS
jgi:hypothetical protein